MPVTDSEQVHALVEAALVAADGAALLATARQLAATTRDRQVVAVATAYVHGQKDRVDALARDHLVDHPDSVLVARIAALSQES